MKKIYTFIKTWPYSCPIIGGILEKRRLRKLEKVDLPPEYKEDQEAMMERIRKKLNESE
jgi:hypothetical protein